MKDWLTRHGHWLLAVLALIVGVTACLPTITLRVAVGTETASADYGVNLVMTVWRGAQGLVSATDHTLLTAEGLLEVLAETQPALMARTLIPLAAAMVCGVMQPVLAAVLLIKAMRNRVDRGFLWMSAIGTVMGLLTLLGWQLAVKPLSDALTAADRTALLGFDTATVTMQPTAAWFLPIMLGALLLIGAWRLRVIRRNAPKPEITPIL